MHAVSLALAFVVAAANTGSAALPSSTSTPPPESFCGRTCATSSNCSLSVLPGACIVCFADKTCGGCDCSCGGECANSSQCTGECSVCFPKLASDKGKCGVGCGQHCIADWHCLSSGCGHCRAGFCRSKTDDSLPLKPTMDQAPAPAVHVKKVHVLFSHHLDVGLDIGLKLTVDCVGFATKIIQRYFDDFIPRAIKLAQETRTKGKDQFAYTMHPWILSLYRDCDPWTIEDGCALNPGTLRCPSTAEIATFDAAVLRGDILWASSPMNLDPGAVGSPGLFKDLLTISSDLDSRHNITKQTKVWSNIDVPGFVRSSVPLLVDAGVKFLYIGANGSPLNITTPAKLFRWRDPASQKEVVVMYHQGYGSKFKLSGGDGDLLNSSLIGASSGVALASYFRSDNTGPPSSISEIKSIFQEVRKAFPGAVVVSSTFDAFAAELTQADIAQMDTLKQEWGDPWIGGLQTDPWRIQVYREMLRLRDECLDSGACTKDSVALRNMTRWLAKISEHTQGVQSEGWSPGVPGCTLPDGSFQSPCTTETNKHWSNEEFGKIHNDKKNLFVGADLSLIESRKFNELAIGALDAQASNDKGAASLAASIKRHLLTLRPQPSSLVGLRKVTSAGAVLRCGLMELGMDNESGVITHLVFDAAVSTTTWAAGPAAGLMDLRYMTYGGNDRANLTCNESGCPNPVFSSNRPTLKAIHTNCSVSTGAADCSVCRVVAVSEYNETLSGKYGSPTTIYTELMLIPGSREVSVHLKLFNKTTTRLPEATVVVFNPQLASSSFSRDNFTWGMDILGGWVDAYDVAYNAVKQFHAIWTGVKFAKSDSSVPGLFIESLDAAMACPLIFQRDENGTAGAIPPGASYANPIDLDGSGWACANNWGGDNLPDELSRIATPHTRGVGGMAIQLHCNTMGISGFAQWYPFGTKSEVPHKSTYEKADENILFRFRIREQ